MAIEETQGMEECGEKDLLERCRRGDRQAFAELVDRYQGLVFTLVERMVYDKSLSEDLAQEVFLRVYQALPGFRGTSKLSTWIYRITYNVCAAELERARYRVDFLHLDRRSDEEETPFELPDTARTPEEQFSRLDCEQHLQQLMERLPPRYKMILAIYYMEEMSYEEIGKIMDLPLGTVKTYLHRAKQALRAMIMKEGLWEEMTAEFNLPEVAP